MKAALIAIWMPAESVMDGGSKGSRGGGYMSRVKGSRSSIYVRMQWRQRRCMHATLTAGTVAAVAAVPAVPAVPANALREGLIEDLVRQVWRIRIQIWRHLLRGRGIKEMAPSP